MTFIEKQEGALAPAQMLPRRGVARLQFGDGDIGGGKRLETHVDEGREQARQGCLAGAGRAPENHGAEPPGSNHAGKRRIGPGQMVLPNDILDTHRPEPFRQRLGIDPQLPIRWSGGNVLTEEFHHARRPYQVGASIRPVQRCGTLNASPQAPLDQD